MHARPRLLFLSQTLPYPPDSGVQVRTYNILRLLARTFDVTALCFYRWKGGAVQRDVEASVAALSSLADVQAFPIPQEHRRERFVWDHLRSVMLRRVYTAFVYESRDFRARLLDVLRSGRFDLVHADSLDLAAYLPLIGRTPVVCVHHNVESLLLRRRASAERTAWRRAYLRYQAKLTQEEERDWCERVDLNVTVSEKDRAALQHLAPNGKFTVVPNGVDDSIYRPAPGREDGIVFVGGNTWFPNQDALDYFCDAILPRIRDAGETASVRWVGWASESEQQSYRARYGVELTGYVEDIAPYVQDAACYVVPLRVGSGTRVKILYAWAMGKAVVSTSIGCEGLAAKDAENILVRDTPEEFADAVRAVLHDGELRRRLGENGRKTVEQLYSWEVIGEPMIHHYLDLVQPKGKAEGTFSRATDFSAAADKAATGHD
jgi:glycosyltransferase involved in cell wall biosynthesis